MKVYLYYYDLQRVSRQAEDGFGSALQMVQLGMKYLPIAMNLFNSLTKGSDGASSGIGGGGSGGILDLAASILGGVTGNTKVETSAGVDPVKTSASDNNVDRIDPTDLIKVIQLSLLDFSLLLVFVVIIMIV